VGEIIGVLKYSALMGKYRFADVWGSSPIKVKVKVNGIP